MRHGWRQNQYRIVILLLLLCIATCTGLYFLLGGYSAYDINGHWKICTYALRGYDPFKLIGQKAVLDSVGKIPTKFATVPWNCIFGGIFYGSFLSLEHARIYIWVLHFVIYIITVITLWRKYESRVDKKILFACALVILAQFSFMYSIHYGNAGGIICCLIIIAVCIMDEHPWLSGVCMGLAMMKPQIAAIVCVVFLLNRRWKPIILAAVIDITGWIVTAVHTGTGILELLSEMFSSGTASDKQYLGLLSIVQYVGVSRSWVILLNVLLGVVYTIGLWWYLKNKSNCGDNAVILYAPACIASTFWIYKNGTDYLILALAAFFFVFLCTDERIIGRHFLMSLFGLGYLLMSRCAVYVGVIVSEDTVWGRDMCKSIDGLFLAIIGIVLCRLWVTYHPCGDK